MPLKPVRSVVTEVEVTAGGITQGDVTRAAATGSTARALWRYAAFLLPWLTALVLPVPYNGAIGGLPSLCVFHLATGLPCPACGLTRAVVCCAHGQWTEALGYHPLGPLVFMAFVGLAAIGVLGLMQPLRARKIFALAATSTVGIKWISCITGVALIAVWLARLTGWLPLP